MVRIHFSPAPKTSDSIPKGENLYFHEMRFDGDRIQTHLKNKKADFFTRNGVNWSGMFPHLFRALEKIDDGSFMESCG